MPGISTGHHPGADAAPSDNNNETTDMAKATAVKKTTKTATKKAIPNIDPPKRAARIVTDVSDAANANPGFKVGDSVKWSSSAQGSTTTKTGTVIAVIPGGKKSADTVRKQVQKREKTRNSAFGYGGDRDHESYLVAVPQGTTGRAKPKLYWPVVSKLQRA